MSKFIEKSFIIHILLLGLIFIFLYKTYSYNIFDETYKIFDEYKEKAIEEVNIALKTIEENPSEYEMDIFDIADYKVYNENFIEQSSYYMYYYMPSFYILLVLLIVLIENGIYRAIKLQILCSTYDAKKDKGKEKLIEIIREKLNFKYRRINLPKQIPYVCVFLYIANLIIDFESDVMQRTVDNMIFALVTIIFVYGIRVTINLFKTKSTIARILIIFINIFLAILIPQMYFLIGFFKSIFSIKVIVKMNNDDSDNTNNTNSHNDNNDNE